MGLANNLVAGHAIGDVLMCHHGAAQEIILITIANNREFKCLK
jgi:hypothetical protein